MTHAPLPSPLRLLRFAHGLTQAELADRVHVSQSHLSRVERGLRRPGGTLRARIAAVLAVNPTSLFPEVRKEDRPEKRGGSR